MVGMTHAAVTIYVATNGNDAGKGTIDSPFATLEQARDAVRALKHKTKTPLGELTIVLRGGVYRRNKPFILDSGNTGTSDSPIVYRNYADETVHIVGGEIINGFRHVADYATRVRLDKNARAHILCANLKHQGITDFGNISERRYARPKQPPQMELFFNDQPMTLARKPNKGYFKIADLPNGERAHQFSYSPDLSRRWGMEPDIWLHGYWGRDWDDIYLKVESIDFKKRVITTIGRTPYGIRKGQRWYALNLLCELDSPGEYYIDRKHGILYFWPPEPIETGNALVSTASQLVIIKNAEYITIQGLILEGCRGKAITISGGSNNQIVGCTIRNIGGKAVRVAGGTRNAVIGCHIYNCGEGGISLRGGHRKTLSPAFLLAENNHIHNYSRWCYTYRPAVGVWGCGNIVRHNHIHHAPHNAIQLSGNDHLVEFNDVHDVCYDTGDVGAFYMGRNWTARGTIIRYNYWHHINAPGKYGAMGIYLDDQASGITIYGNIFYDVSRAAFIGGGCDNLVENNIFVDCKTAVHIDARGMNFHKSSTDDPEGTLRTQLAAMPYQNELWKKRYPNLVNILNDNPGTPKRNKIIRNICVGGKWDDIDKKTRKYQIIAHNFIDDNPHFVDREGLDFRLKQDSPAFQTGFKPIPIEKIGQYENCRK